jgi:DnaJ-class molecular chaperone
MRGGNSGEPCHYAALGVPKTATTEEIKEAFRKLSMQIHPDVAGAKTDIERFKAISQAASILTNEKNRRIYDMQQQEQSTLSFFRQPSSFHNNNYKNARKPYSEQKPASGTFTSFLVKMFRPSNMILGPIALYAACSAIQWGLGIGDNHHQNENVDTVQAWMNPQTGRYETPAPWDPVYQKLRPNLESIPRHQVTTRTR